jgi:hypothetical protein
MTVTLTQAIVEIHMALDSAGLAHAFGGALALAWCTEEPRATIDIDVNVFVPPNDAPKVLAALPRGISHDGVTQARLERDGQDRLFWGRIAVDVFLSNTPFHDTVRTEVLSHPFAGHEVPFLGCQSLATFKAFFNRDKDWLDLGSMIEIGRLDEDRLARDLTELLGPDDPRVAKLAALRARG